MATYFGFAQFVEYRVAVAEKADNSIVIGIHIVQKITMKKFLFWNLTLCHNAPRDKQINCNCSAVHNYNYNHFPAQRCQNIFKNHTTCNRFDERKPGLKIVCSYALFVQLKLENVQSKRNILCS